MENRQKIVENFEKLIVDLQAEPLLKYPSRAMEFAAARERNIVILAGEARKTPARVQKIRESMKLGENAKISSLSTPKADEKTLPLLADGFVLLVDASRAWTRNEARFYGKSLTAGTPIAVALVGIDEVDEAEQDEVISYVENHVGTHENTQFLTFEEAGDCDEVAGTLLRDFFEKSFASTEFQKSRSRLVSAYFSALLESLNSQMEKLKNKEKSENEAKRERIFKEETKLDSGTLFWNRLNREFSNRRRGSENALTKNIHDKFKLAEDELQKEAKNSPSIQDWWKKDFQERLNKWYEEIGKKVFALANEQLKKDCARIKQKIEQNFHVPIEIVENADGENLSETGTKVGEVSGGVSADKKRAVRLGLLAIGAIAQCILPIPGLMILVPNVVGELALPGIEKKAKEAAKAEISRIVSETAQKMEEACLKAIRDGYESNMQAFERALEEWVAGTQEKIDAQKDVPANAAITSLRENCEKLLAEIKTEIETL